MPRGGLLPNLHRSVVGLLHAPKEVVKKVTHIHSRLPWWELKYCCPGFLLQPWAGSLQVLALAGFAGHGKVEEEEKLRMPVQGAGVECNRLKEHLLGTACLRDDCASTPQPFPG